MVVIKEVTSDFEYDENTLNHLKNVQVNILKDFIETCDENNLNYVIHGGTALGAVRHGGFIPWDDEIDVLMFREDYEKFLKLFEKENDKYYLSNWNTEINKNNKYLTPKTLLCLKNTKLSRLGETGIYIDINVFDNIPAGKIKNKLFMKKMKLLHFSMNLLSTIQADRYTSKNKEKIGHSLNIIFKLFRFTPEFISKIFTKNIKKYHNQTECMLDMTVYYETPIRKKYFKEIIQIEFENISVNIPKEYDYILKRYYGDYMKLPPVEERRNHYYGEIDFGKY